IIVSVFLNGAVAYALAYDVIGSVRFEGDRGVPAHAGHERERLALLAGVAFGGSPYIAAHLFGHFDLLTAWVIPLFALLLRRALMGPAGPKRSALRTVGAAVGCGLCAAGAAYSAYY